MEEEMSTEEKEEPQERAEILKLATKELLNQTATYCENVQKYFTTYPELKLAIATVFELQCFDDTVAQMILGHGPKVRKIITNLQEVIEE